MLIYLLGDKQYTRWWEQFGVVASPLLHDNDDDYDNHHYHNHQAHVVESFMRRSCSGSQGISLLYAVQMFIAAITTAR
jgi:hypothetical protein